MGDRIGFDGAALAKASRLTAKVDSAAVQDGFDLYLHGFIVSDEGRWAVFQQGMNGDRRQARCYHWLSEGMTSFVEEPHAAIEGQSQGHVINLTDRRAEQSRRKQIELLGSVGPERIAPEAAVLSTGPPVGRPRRGRRKRNCRSKRHCRILSCRRVTTCARAMSICGDCMATLPPRLSAGPPTFPICC